MFEQCIRWLGICFFLKRPICQFCHALNFNLVLTKDILATSSIFKEALNHGIETPLTWQKKV